MLLRTEVGIKAILVRFDGLFERLQGAFWGQNLSKNFSFEKIGLVLTLKNPL